MVGPGGGATQAAKVVASAKAPTARGSIRIICVLFDFSAPRSCGGVSAPIKR
jgi:hypothetical protein